MSIPYYSSNEELFGYPMPNGDSYIEYPFYDLGDFDTKIYHIVCSIRKEAYTPINTYRFVVSGVNTSTGTPIGSVTMVWDGVSFSDNAPIYRDAGNNYEIAKISGIWNFYNQTTFDPYAYSTDNTKYPWEAQNWLVLAGTGTLTFTTNHKFPPMDSVLNDNNAKVTPNLPVGFYDNEAYFIGDYNHSVDGDMITFDRQFANIPSSTTINSGTEIYSFPGLPNVAGTGSNININSLSVSNNQTTFTLASAHGMSVGDYAFLNYKATRTVGTTTYTYYYYSFSQAITGTTGSTFVTKGGIEGQTLVGTGTFKPNATKGRKQVSRTSPTEIVRDYFLPGVSAGITQPQDITLSEPFVAYRYSEGNEVKTLSSTTTPTADEYRDIVATDGYLTRSTDVKKWKGNILVRETKQIRAI